MNTTGVAIMTVSIIVYDKSTMDRVKQRIHECFAIEDNYSVDTNILWLSDMYIKFQERIITINLYKKNAGLDECLDMILENEHVMIKYNDRIEYHKSFSHNPKLLIMYS